jgi:DNA-binding IclR family transcriptional regulator
MSARLGSVSGEVDEERRAQSSVQLISRVANILAALEHEPDGLSLAEIASRVGMARSTVHRLTVGLANEGFVMPASPTGRVRLGPTLARLGISSQREIHEELRPFLHQLSEAVQETVDVAVLDGPDVRFIDQVPGNHRLRAVSSIGAAFPLHCCANGKALLAAMPREQAKRLLPRRLEALTPKTITSRVRLWEELDRIAEAGVAYDREEHTNGISAVGAAVHNGRTIVAAITVVTPTQRFEANVDLFTARLLDARHAIEQFFGAS